MPKMESPKDDVSFEWKIFTFCLLIVIGGGGIWGYRVANDGGWIPHKATINLYFKGEWLKGENKICHGVRKIGTPQEQQGIAGLDCSDLVTGGSTHNLQITFWGKLIRPDVSLSEEFRNFKYQWRCQRGGDDFTCYALN
jgi:hypothetical protein